MNSHETKFFLRVLATIVTCQNLLVQQASSSGSTKLLGVGVVPSVYNEKLNKFNCPGSGNYPVRDNCTQYFHCYFPGHKPTSIYECSGFNVKFHHMTRRCEPARFVDCKLCRQKGFVRDKTSIHHFIRCLHGQIAERYKCLHGEFDGEIQQCFPVFHKGVKSGEVNILANSEPDPPENVEEFMNAWSKIESLELKSKKKKTKDGKLKKKLKFRVIRIKKVKA